MAIISNVIMEQLAAIYYRDSLVWVRTIYRRARVYFLNLTGAIILLGLYIVKPFKFIKLCPLHSKFPHLAADTDKFLRDLQSKDAPGKRPLYLGITPKVINRQLLKMYRRLFPIIESTFLYDVTTSFVLKKSVFYHSLPTHDAGRFFKYEDDKQILSFTEAEEEEGRVLLDKMGIGSNSWFICFYCRDSAYLSSEWTRLYGAREQYNQFDMSYQDFRNDDIKTYLEAAQYITSLGGFAVRMGARVAEKLPDLNNPRIIDYSSDYRTEFGDIYLPAKCKFFLGGTSGLWAIPTIFNVPMACPNFLRFNLIIFRKGSRIIPKKIWSINENRLLTFREILQSEVADYDRDEQYTKAGLKVIANTAEEILDLAIEMNARLDGTFVETEEDEELQARLLSLFPTHLYSYGTPVRIGTVFLRKNKELLKEGG